MWEMIPENRRVSESIKKECIEYLKLGADKKKMQVKLYEETGKLVLLKDIHN